MHNDPLERSSEGFADIVMNLLAILIVVTLIALLFVSSRTIPTIYAVDAPAQRDRVFPVLRLEGVAALSTAYYVSGSTLSELDFDPLAEAVLETGIGDGQAELLEPGWAPVDYELQVSEGQFGRDPGGFVFRLRLPQAPEDADVLASESALMRILSQTVETGRVPSFYVAQSGFALFSQMESALLERGLCFRWFPVIDNELIYMRHQEYFTQVSARRCKP